MGTSSPEGSEGDRKRASARGLTGSDASCPSPSPRRSPNRQRRAHWVQAADQTQMPLRWSDLNVDGDRPNLTVSGTVKTETGQSPTGRPPQRRTRAGERWGSPDPQPSCPGCSGSSRLPTRTTPSSRPTTHVASGRQHREAVAAGQGTEPGHSGPLHRQAAGFGRPLRAPRTAG